MSTLSIKHTIWNFSQLFSSDTDAAIEKDRTIVERENKKFVDKWQKRNDYLSDAAVLKQALDEYELLIRTYGTSGKEGYYFWLRSTQDQLNPEIKAKFAKA